IPIPHPDNPKNVAGIEIVGNSAKFKAKLVSGEPQAQIKIKIKGKFGDQWLNAPALKTEEPTEDPEFYRKLGEGLEKKIKSGVEELLTKAQTDFDADILGVGDYIMNRYPNDWDIVADNWREYYKKTTFDVEVKVDITSANIMHSRPPVMEDPE
ncbi:MAG: Ger(x)C family spore germination C-terminal domain-containing protein, partial [Desulfitobacteriaceae bacterium]|nr:Ger(x)C family spore germination C-terminal domain-containing protein [Desulfitobacteriaceae bacterium]MDI6881196.1 Ger(x)C family spore germination C-terminal domain-containing protein [Desulfitobacteriaceae bacterium]